MTDINKRRKLEYEYKIALVRKKKLMKKYQTSNFQVSLPFFIFFYRDKKVRNHLKREYNQLNIELTPQKKKTEIKTKTNYKNGMNSEKEGRQFKMHTSLLKKNKGEQNKFIIFGISNNFLKNYFIISMHIGRLYHKF